jgi:hypothetical protein
MQSVRKTGACARTGGIAQRSPLQKRELGLELRAWVSILRTSGLLGKKARKGRRERGEIRRCPSMYLGGHDPVLECRGGPGHVEELERKAKKMKETKERIISRGRGITSTSPRQSIPMSSVRDTKGHSQQEENVVKR